MVLMKSYEQKFVCCSVNECLIRLQFYGMAAVVMKVLIAAGFPNICVKDFLESQKRDYRKHVHPLSIPPVNRVRNRGFKPTASR